MNRTSQGAIQRAPQDATRGAIQGATRDATPHVRVCAILLALVANAMATVPAPAQASVATSAAAKPVASDSGTTIVGDQDAAIGLDLLPWKDEAAADIDRAPGWLDQSPQAFDIQAFRQRIEADDALAAYRRSHLEQNR